MCIEKKIKLNKTTAWAPHPFWIFSFSWLLSYESLPTQQWICVGVHQTWTQCKMCIRKFISTGCPSANLCKFPWKMTGFALFKISQNNAKLWTHLKINMKWKVLELENVGRDLIDCTFINAIIYVFFFIFLLLYFIALFNFLIFLILVLHFISIPMYVCTHVSCMFELFLYFLLYCKLLSPRQIPWVCKHTIKPFLISDFWFCQKLIRSLEANCCNLKWVTACWKTGIKSSEKICFSLKTVTWNLIMICTVTYLL